MHILLGRNNIFSGQHEAQIRKYHLYNGRGGRIWLVSDQPNAADNVYVSNKNNNPGKGFGGARLTMLLVDGGEFVLNGGWHSNADSLYTDTGIDVRDTCLTRVIIGKNRTSDPHYITIITDVLYFEHIPHLGIFNRKDALCEEAMTRFNLDNVIYYSKSKGGSSCGWYIYHKKSSDYPERPKYDSLDPADIVEYRIT